MRANIIPMQRLIGKAIERGLVGEFISAAIEDPARFMVTFDLSDVRVLREDAKARSERWKMLFEAGVATRAEARRAMDLSADDADEIYLVPVSMLEVRQGTSVYDAPVDGGSGA